MPAVSCERPMRHTTFMHTTPLDTAMGLPPRPRNSSFEASSSASSSSVAPAPTTLPSLSAASSSSSSGAGLSLMKPRRRHGSIDFALDTPFEKHLADIYSGKADDGLAFFESNGYYDVSDANTVAMFRQNFGLRKKFWEGDEEDFLFYDEINIDTVDLAALQVLSVGSMLSKNVKRQRTTSGRFQLLDDEGNEVDAEAELEAEKEKRMKLKHLEVDDDDLEELAQEQIVLAKAITVIRTEKTRFKKYFFEACNDQAIPRVSVATEPRTQVVPQQPSPSLSLQLPPYSGYLYILKDTIPHLFRSWHKRWFYLDFNTGLGHMYKRSYWKSPRGVLDMRTICNITRMNQSDICVQCFDGRSMLLRSKAGSADADLWLNLLQFARRQVGNNNGLVPSQPMLPPSTNAMALQGLTTTTTTTVNSTGFLVSTKLRAESDRSVLEMMAVVLQSKTSTTSSANMITAA